MFLIEHKPLISLVLPDFASVCRSVSTTSLPGSESVSDGDSLLGPDTADDTVFKQVCVRACVCFLGYVCVYFN